MDLLTEYVVFMKRNLLIILVVIFASCQQQKSERNQHVKQKDYTQWVNPFIGTGNMGHTFPGAVVPFGMVQLSPETSNVPMFNEKGEYNKEVYRYCAGYQYADSALYGFSHTHFSGTGHSDLGDFRVMPTIGEVQLKPGTPGNVAKGYVGKLDKNSEEASPGYYKVRIADSDIHAELTATERVGFHKYIFPKDVEANLIFDLMSNIYHHKNKNVWTFVRVENDTLVTGYRQTKGWARTRKVYFAMAFSKPIKSYGHKVFDEIVYNGFYRRFDEEHNFPEMAGKNLRAWFRFDNAENHELLVKFALSGVSSSGALANMQAEVPLWSFEKVHEQAREKWNRELGKVDVQMPTKADKETFYTALYHSFLSPVVFEDVDGNYRGLDQEIHQSNGFTNYTIFSLWDTFRALHPLFNLLQPERNNDMVKSMLAHYRQSVHPMLPIWSHYASENWCMIGYHSVPVIVDAVVKGTTDVDLTEALEACVTTSQIPYFDGLDQYMKLGYVPSHATSSSVSKTLEFAYDDWCIAQLAEKAGSQAIAEEYNKRAQSYRQVYDAQLGFMRPKDAAGKWREPFDPMNTHGQGFIEGNAWTYSLFVPHQVEEMIELMGGNKAFVARLDSLFTMTISDEHIAHNEDITRDGIIGNYVHGNEPGHHIPYLYNWAGAPRKTQARVRMIMDTMYGNEIEGLCGNDDAGQMSAWYIFSALGFYPVAPGSPLYALGSPKVEQAKVFLPNGKILEIEARNQSTENVYVERVELNGVAIEDHQISHEQLLTGGKLVFYMTN